MTYAQGRLINDADSHIMELPDFLRSYADPATHDVAPKLPVPTVGALAVLDPDSAAAGRHSPAQASWKRYGSSVDWASIRILCQRPPP